MINVMSEERERNRRREGGQGEKNGRQISKENSGEVHLRVS